MSDRTPENKPSGPVSRSDAASAATRGGSGDTGPGNIAPASEESGRAVGDDSGGTAPATQLASGRAGGASDEGAQRSGRATGTAAGESGGGTDVPSGGDGEATGDPSGEIDGGTDIAAAIQQAEVLLDQAGQRAGEWAARMSLRLRKLGALAREEAEDIWAEAQSIRRREPR